MSPVDAYTHTPLHQSTMSSSSETTFTLKTCGKIDKLTQYNYLRWSSCMMDHFDSARYLDIVLGEKECPPPTSSETDQNSEAYEKWKGNDAKARAILKGACSDELRNHIEKIGTSAEMWKILEKYANSASSIKGRERLLNYFERLKPKTGESISKFLGEITSIRDQLKNTDQEITDRTFRNKILKNLPNVPQYAMVKTLIDHERTPSTTNDIIEMLKDTEIELEESVTLTSENTAATSETALYTTDTHGQASTSRGRGGFRGRRPFNRRFNTRRDNTGTPYSNYSPCNICGKRGHRTSDCFQRACFNCGETTHISHDCKYATLTQEQARKGRSAFATWTAQKNSTALANPALATETIDPGL